ncbi:hypothetical protein [Nonomuraea sp. NPDC003709]|uniref:hypothetical protein n=1 Tax=Nonomuraea sp. NPDC003709 TaxID=3154450 RepID=UPI0033AB77D3
MITGAAHRVARRLAKIVYFNAFVPARGVPFVDENQDYAAILRAAIDASPDGSVSVTFEQVPMLVPELPEAAQRLFHELLVPQPGAYFLQALDVDDVTTLGLPAAYVLSENDLALARPGDELAARIGLTPLMVPGGHQSMLSTPTRSPRRCSSADRWCTGGNAPVLSAAPASAAWRGGGPRLAAATIRRRAPSPVLSSWLRRFHGCRENLDERSLPIHSEPVNPQSCAPPGVAQRIKC